MEAIKAYFSFFFYMNSKPLILAQNTELLESPVLVISLKQKAVLFLSSVHVIKGL